ncbi:oligosaccharyl transferase subunit ost3/OST6 [Basidiobolus ranarum]|uniref:Oligosaccharyl transferase subunit ost3/OST6 n=1 Tax=Basidiobolus ranarum TaxID=34480 RepID=A0ABR2X459_9FUNG
MRAKIVSYLLLCLGLLAICSASPEKIQSLENLPADSNGVIKLNTASFELLTSKPRNYAAIVVLTALNPAFSCGACGIFEPNYKLLSKSWLTTKEPSQLYFGQLEVDDGREVFMKLGIQSAPYILYYPPTEGPHAQTKDFIVYEVNSKGLQAEPLAEFLSQQLETEVPINYPFDWAGNGLKLLAGLVVILFSYFVFTRFSAIIASNRMWSSISLVIILMMTSGHMWNQIRGPPYVVPGPKGETQYFVPGQMQQIGVESQIITVLYASCAFCIVFLGIHVPKMSEFKQRFAVLIFAGILLVSYSAVIYVFRIKSAGYPYRLLF